jgi:hypothetical protein
VPPQRTDEEEECHIGAFDNCRVCERKHRHLATSGYPSIAVLTLAFAVVAYRLVLSGCRAFAACSPPVAGRLPGARRQSKFVAKARPAEVAGGGYRFGQAKWTYGMQTT